MSDYVPDKLFARLFQPWTLHESEWPLCKEDWQRVDAITALPWQGHILDFGAGDGTLAAMVASRNPKVRYVACIEQDARQRDQIVDIHGDGWPLLPSPTITAARECHGVPFDAAMCCEVLEHLTPEDGAKVLREIHDAMKPGGMLCVTVPLPHGSRSEYPGHVNVMDRHALYEVLYHTGFTPQTWQVVANGIWQMVVARA